MTYCFEIASSWQDMVSAAANTDISVICNGSQWKAVVLAFDAVFSSN